MHDTRPAVRAHRSMDRSAAALEDLAAAAGVVVGRLPGAFGLGALVLLAVAQHLAAEHLVVR